MNAIIIGLVSAIVYWIGMLVGMTVEQKDKERCADITSVCITIVVIFVAILIVIK